MSSCCCACHRTFGVVELTQHALYRMAERLPGQHAKSVAAAVQGGMMTDWSYLPDWFRLAPWSKRGNDRYVLFRCCRQEVVAVIAADSGRGPKRVVKKIKSKSPKKIKKIKKKETSPKTEKSKIGMRVTDLVCPG